MSAYDGKIVTIQDRLMTGWISTPDSVADVLAVEFLANGRLLGTALAQRDLANGAATGSEADLTRLNFEFLLPRLLADGGPHEISARIGSDEIVLENASYHPQAAQRPAVPPVGFVDGMSPDAEITGWAWYPEMPTSRVELEFLADGVVIGSGIAELDRPDLSHAGIGDGHYGYRWMLPAAVLAAPRQIILTVRDKHTHTQLPKPLTYIVPRVADALSKIAELEADVRLLRSTLAALQEQPKQEDQAARALFATVGQFFTRLAETGSGAATPDQPAPLSDAVAALTATLRHFSLPADATPLVSVFVTDAPEAAATHATLRALGDALATLPAEIFLLDTGQCPDSPLLPLVAQNLRYARPPGGPAARCNAAMRLAAGGIVIFIAGGLHPAPGWAATLPKFARDAALFTGQIIDEAPGANSPALFALRRSAWAQLGGLDETSPSLAAALDAFATHAAAAGLTTSTEPGFTAVLGDRT